MIKERYDFNDLLQIMALLRAENGCPWDKEQTHESLKKYLIEETYEVLEQIDTGNKEKLYDELGDLLLQVVFHAQIATEEGNFTIEDITTAICRKLVSRHTHIFGEDHADTAEEVLTNWEAIKKKEKGHQTQTSVLKDVPPHLPALMRSCKVQQKAAQVGFDWDNIEDVFNKIEEEFEELREVYQGDDPARKSEELGDVLFSVVNLARFLKVQPELALTDTTNKFIRRFEYVESTAAAAGKQLQNMMLAEMDALWNEAKERE